MNRFLILMLTIPMACAAEEFMPFYGEDKTGRQIMMSPDLEASNEEAFAGNSFEHLPAELYWTRNESVTRLRLDIGISSLKDGAESALYKGQKCEWTLHYRNVKNPKSPTGIMKHIVKSSLYCLHSGTSPVAGSYYEALGYSSKYVCKQNCAKNPFKVLHKDPSPEEEE